VITSVEGIEPASKRLEKLHKQLDSSGQRWVFTQMLDELYEVQQAWWKKEFGGKSDKSPRRGNPPRYMFKSGDLFKSATSDRGPGAYAQATDEMAIVTFRGGAFKLAEVHRSLGRDVLADLTTADEKRIVEKFEGFIFAAAEGSF
jgi:hypothetical protein